MLSVCLLILASAQLLSRNLCLAASQNINSMSVAELNEYRDCVRIGLSSGHYLTIAGEHGVPQGLCPHGNMKFLPWHRHHLAAWESLMNCTIPYWDWARDPVPTAFLEESYTDATGRTWPNPLLLGQQPHQSHRIRSIAQDFPTNDLQNGQNLALSRTDLEAFSSALEDAHNLVHVSVGGDMSDIDYAAYDVIFYSHHKNVDRLWFIWQTSPIRNPLWSAPLANDYVDTSAGTLSSLQIANDLSAWMSIAPNKNNSTTDALSTGTLLNGNADGNTAGNTAGTSAGMNQDAGNTAANIASGSSNSITGSTGSNSGLSDQSGSSLSGSNTNGSAGLSSGSVMSNSDQSGITGSLSSGNTGADMGDINSATNHASGSIGASSLSGSRSATGLPMGNLNDRSGSSTLSGVTSNAGLGTGSLSSISGSGVLDAQRLEAIRSAATRMGSKAGSAMPSSALLSSTNMMSPTVQAQYLFRDERQLPPSSSHVLIRIPSVKSTIQGYRMDVIMASERIGRIGLLGMGAKTMAAMPHMAYSKDRLLDVSCHFENVTDLAQARNQIRFELYNDKNVLVDNPHLNFTLFHEYF